jgi:biopolymer transport protein ExbB/TolQ
MGELMISPSNTAFYAFKLTDSFGRFIVVLLFLFSIHSWTIMIEKTIAVRRARRWNRHFLRDFRQTQSPLGLALKQAEYNGPAVHVFQAGIEELAVILGTDAKVVEGYCRKGALPRTLSSEEIEKMRSTLMRHADSEFFALENKLGLLGTAVTLSPFLGLLGTVWGVLGTFCQMAARGRPEMSEMAPGVAGALLTTVAGLAVAIPALVGFNLLSYYVRQTGVETDHFVEEFLARLRLQAPSTPARPTP